MSVNATAPGADQDPLKINGTPTRIPFQTNEFFLVETFSGHSVEDHIQAWLNSLPGAITDPDQELHVHRVDEWDVTPYVGQDDRARYLVVVRCILRSHRLPF